MGRKVTYAIAATIAALAVGLFLWLLIMPVEAIWPRDKFSGLDWRKTPEGERYKMARDLVDSRVLLGKTRESVSEILGKADSTAPDGSYQSYILKNTQTIGAIFPGIVVLDVRYRDDIVHEVMIRSI